MKLEYSIKTGSTQLNDFFIFLLSFKIKDKY